MTTPRENYVAFATRKPYEWTPVCDVAQINPDILPTNVARGLIVQQNPCEQPYGGLDCFGVEWVFQPEVGGSMEVGHILKYIDEWEEKIVWPDFKSYNWEKCAQDNAELIKTDKAICTTIFSGYFERLISLIGFEEALVAMVDEDDKEEVKRLFDKLTDSYIELVGLYKKYINLDIVNVHDDWGAQKAPFFSEETMREMILPYMKRLVSACHDMGVVFDLHSCGKQEANVPLMIEMGIDTWCGQEINDKRAIYDKYGDKIRIGMEVRSPGGLSDEEVIALAQSYVDNWAGCDVYFWPCGKLGPGQRDLMIKTLTAKGKI